MVYDLVLTKTYYPFWYERILIIPNKLKLVENETIDDYDYAVITENTEDYAIVTILVELSEKVVSTKDFLKKEYNLTEFDNLKEIAEELKKTLIMNKIAYEFECFVITPIKEIKEETIETKGIVSIAYGQIEGNEIKFEPLLRKALIEEIPSGIITILPTKGDPLRMVKAARIVNSSIALARTYYWKLLERYKTYEELTPKISKLTSKTFELLQKITKQGLVSMSNLNELAELTNELAQLANAATHDYANAEANYLNLRATLETITIPSKLKEEIIGRLVYNAWKILAEKIKTTTETVIATYNTIRAKLQLESISKQTQMMEIDRSSQKYLGWIQIFTGAMLVGDLVHLILTRDVITFMAIVSVVLLIYLLMWTKE